MTKRLADCPPEQQAKMRTSAALYRIKNREKITAYNTAYHGHRYRTEPEYRARRDASAEKARTKTRYGLTKEQVQEKLVAQNFKCMICDKQLHKRTRGGYHIDHCHKTNKTRDILCAGCNVFLGRIESKPGLLQTFLNYIEKHK